MMQKKSALRNRSYGAALLASAVFFAVLAVLVPFILDDYDWGGPRGEQLLASFFDGYNGRYLGNLLALGMTRFLPLRILVMAVGMVLLLHLMTRFVTGQKDVKTYLASFCLILASFLPGFVHPKLNLFAQTVAWQSGFVNYVVSAVLILALAVLLKEEEEEQAQVRQLENIITPDGEERRSTGFAARFLRLVGLFLLGLISCVSLETTTFYICLLSALVACLRLLRNKKRCGSFFRGNPLGRHLWYLLGNVAGGALMVSNSSYRQIADGSYTEAPRRFGFLNVEALLNELSGNGVSLKLALVGAAALGVIFLALFLLPCVVTKDRALRKKLYFCLISALALTLPILFANGDNVYLFSIRLYFPQYVLLAVYLILLVKAVRKARELPEQTANKKNEAPGKSFGLAALIALSAVMAAGLLVLYAQIHRVEERNIGLIEFQLESHAQVILVEEYPAYVRRLIPFSDADSNIFMMNTYWGLTDSQHFEPVDVPAH